MACVTSRVRRGGLRGALLCVVLSLLAGETAKAEDLPAALGRISYGETPQPGAAICTGVLVAPDLVLTAGHCVRDMAAADIRFAAGHAAGRSLALRRGAQVILAATPVPGAGSLPPSGAGTDAAIYDSLALDVALLRLDRPIPADLVAPLPLALPVTSASSAMSPLTLIAYSRSSPDVVRRSDACALVASYPGLLGLSCPVVSGNSGAPVLQWVGSGADAGWQIVAVMVAATRAGPLRALAARPPADLRALIAGGDAPGP